MTSNDVFVATCENRTRCKATLTVPREGRDDDAWSRAITSELRRGKWDHHADSDIALCYVCSGRKARDARRETTR